MPYYCTVPRCTSMAGKAKNVSFHQFPRDEELAKLWNKILKRGKPYTKYSKVCSLHFTADDYTMTSAGKNKGQWRTLRKDAIPSQNLPSESPTPYQRKQWGSWAHSPPSNTIDPAIHQQMARAIYMQTILAMQAAGAPEIHNFTHSNGLPVPAPAESFAQTSSAPDTDILKGKQTNTEQNTSYKCTECSKCFKDPDVFILHKRTHMKHEKTEKENFNLNLTLQANPILANLLKTSPENSNIFDNNLMSMENLLMTALATNMEGYMRNFTSMIKGEHRNGNDHDHGESDHDQDESDHDHGESDHVQGESDHDEEIINHEVENFSHEQNKSNHDKTDFTNRGNYDHSLDLRHSSNKDCQSTTLKLALDRSRGVTNYERNNSELIKYQNRANPIACDNNVFQNSLLERILNNSRNIRQDIMYNGNLRNGDLMENYGRSVIDQPMIDHDNGITNNDDSQGLNTEPNCDSDLNESVDSNKLVIDENA